MFRLGHISSLAYSPILWGPLAVGLDHVGPLWQVALSAWLSSSIVQFELRRDMEPSPEPLDKTGETSGSITPIAGQVAPTSPVEPVLVGQGSSGSGHASPTVVEPEFPPRPPEGVAATTAIPESVQLISDLRGHVEAIRGDVENVSSDGDSQGQESPAFGGSDPEADIEDYYTRVTGFTPGNMPYYDRTGHFDEFVSEDKEYDDQQNIVPSRDRPFGEEFGRTMGCQTPFGWTIDPFCILSPFLEELQEGHHHAVYAKEAYQRRNDFIRDNFWNIDRIESVYKGVAWGLLELGQESIGVG